jgi:hypothetical protein
MGPGITSDTSEVTESAGIIVFEGLVDVVSVREPSSSERILSINFAGIKSYTGGKN